MTWMWLANVVADASIFPLPSATRTYLRPLLLPLEGLLRPICQVNHVCLQKDSQGAFANDSVVLTSEEYEIFCDIWVVDRTVNSVLSYFCT